MSVSRRLPPTFPRHIERRLAAVALRYVRSWLRPVQRRALQALKERRDVDLPDITAWELLSILTSTEVRVGEAERVSASRLGRYGELVYRHANGETQRLLKQPSVRAVDPTQGNAQILAAWAEEAASRIVIIEEAYRERTARIIEQAYREGWGRERIARAIVQLGAATENRALLWARDQVATINGTATQQAHARAGVRFYMWLTSNDERVREQHVERSRVIFAWDRPPAENEHDGHPGQPINCRCVAIPIDPEDEEDELRAQSRSSDLPPYAATIEDL